MSIFPRILSKYFFLYLLLIAITASFSYCSKNNQEEKTLPEIEKQIPPVKENKDGDTTIVNNITLDRSGPLRGKLADEGLCRNYTITVTGGNINPDLIDSLWTNPFSKIKYKYAFGVANFCDFKSVKKGQEFYFEIISPGNTDCINCAAAWPIPGKKLNIKVLGIINN